MKIRVVKTASKARAVQVVRYQNNKRIILRHIGSAQSCSGRRWPRPRVQAPVPCPPPTCDKKDKL